MLIEKVWGHEECIVNTENYCGKVLTLKKDYRCSMHYHKIKDETFLIIKGTVWMECDGESKLMNPGESIRIKPNMKHRFTGITNAKIIEFSTHHEDSDSYRETESERMN